MMSKPVFLRQLDAQLGYQTEGLSAGGRPEIQAGVLDSSLVGECEQFLNFVSAYLLESGTSVRPGETLAYGYWLVKFMARDQTALETWEYAPDTSEFVRGADLTLRYWRDQHLLCQAHRAEFAPPRPDKLTVISAGVLEGLPVQAVRYPSPDHMSGWWITTDRYNGDVNTLRREHTYHVTAARPDLAKYLALPYGFRFDLSATEDVWLDEKVLTR